MRSVTMAVDGASRGNPGAAGIGVVIYDENGTVLKEIGEYIGITTNNVAEYKALIRGLEESLKLGATSITIQTDSELLAKQIAGVYRVKAPHLAELFAQARAHFVKFKEARIGHVYRNENAHADRLASDAARRKADLRQPATIKFTDTEKKPAQKPKPKPTSPARKQASKEDRGRST